MPCIPVRWNVRRDIGSIGELQVVFTGIGPVQKRSTVAVTRRVSRYDDSRGTGTNTTEKVRHISQLL